MIAIDSNLLVYAHRRDSEWHEPARETLGTLAEGSAGYASALLELLRAARPAGPRVHDARIAALCLHAGVRELLSADRDFSRFPKLTTRNPLIA